MSLNRSRRMRRSVLAAVAAGTVGLALAVAPTAVAFKTTPAATHDKTMYDISVKALHGDAGALAVRLMAQGFDVMEKREGSVIHVLGTATTARALGQVSGAAVVGQI